MANAHISSIVHRFTRAVVANDRLIGCARSAFNLLLRLISLGESASTIDKSLTCFGLVGGCPKVRRNGI